MAHFAELDENNVVTKVIVVHNNELKGANGVEYENKGVEFCSSSYLVIRTGCKHLLTIL